MAPQVQSRNCRRILAPHDQHVVVVVRMWFAIVMEDFGQIFAGDIHQIGPIVISDGDDDLAARIVKDAAQAVARRDVEIIVRAHHSFNPLILPQIELVVLGHLAVVLERFQPVGLGIRSGERYVADFQQLRRSEKNHVGRIIKDGIDHAAFIDANNFESGALCFDRTRKAGGAGADNNHIRMHVAAALKLRLGQRVWNVLGGRQSQNLETFRRASGEEILARSNPRLSRARYTGLIMNAGVHEIHGTRLCEYPEAGPLLSTERDATDAIAAAREHGADMLAIPSKRLSDEFFQLKTGVAGNFIQKFVTYGVRLVIVGDISRQIETSSALRDFVYEANRGKHVWFLEDRTELEKKLSLSS